MRILYVEDNLISLTLMERVAQATHQHEIVSCTSAEEALKILESEEIDLIIMDIKLSGEMNGLQLTRMLRKRGDKRPIIVTTAYNALHSKEKVLEAGGNEFLVKPIRIRKILNFLANYSTSV